LSPTAYASPIRAAQKEATRQALKLAAVDLFGKHGFTATAIGDITQAAGVAKGTFYVHFADKDALLDEMLLEFNEGFVEHISPLILKTSAAGAQSLDVPKLVEELAATFLDYWKENRTFIRVYAEKAAGGLSLDALQFGINPQMQSALRQLLAGAAQSKKSDAEIDLIIQGLLSLWLRFGLQWLFNPAVKRDIVTHTLVAMTTGALASALQ
jgi:AcrR family transcriptional regulator